MVYSCIALTLTRSCSLRIFYLSLSYLLFTYYYFFFFFFFFFQAEDGIRDLTVTGVQTCALPISSSLRNRLGTWRARSSHARIGKQERLSVWEAGAFGLCTSMADLSTSAI